MEHLRGKKSEARCHALAFARRAGVCGFSFYQPRADQKRRLTEHPGDCRLQTSAEASQEVRIYSQIYEAAADSFCEVDNRSAQS
jgi:hypothetical protein